MSNEASEPGGRSAGVIYEVLATLRDKATAGAWVDWMLSLHIPEVVAAGARYGRLIQLDEPALTYLAQYEFASRDAYEAYVREHAPRLRAAGQDRFAPGQVKYARRVGTIVAR